MRCPPRAWRSLRATDDATAVRWGAFLGVTATLITSLAGHAYVYAEVAFTFWMAMGLVAGLSVMPLGQRRLEQTRGLVKAATIVCLATLVCSMPFRIGRARDAVNRDIVVYGFYDWEQEGNGRARWMGRRARFFVRRPASSIRFPVLAVQVASESGFELEVRVDGQVAKKIPLGDESWHDVTVELPSSGSQRHARIDLRVDLTWRPIDHLGGSTDARVLGVKLGEVEVQRIRGDAGLED